MEGYPWFPAEVMDPKGPQVPEQILEMQRELNITHSNGSGNNNSGGGGGGNINNNISHASGGNMHLVQFFDLQERGERGRSWYWVSSAQVSPLGIDLEEDRKRVHLKASWNPKRRKSVRLAYLDACSLQGIDSALVLSEHLGLT
ncbi:hypothetical protein BGW38_003958 [Lunasporangiospora selenospora]|uniref:PWWP domain-containing protein n=1 Tax=Lunasporangiospora selenospora TaxID=979761 RepID=A0A9P6FQB9_9FUNG|nr:hypothetical protein BGW38_003958 [Lunasporangiospora selenospora]